MQLARDNPDLYLIKVAKNQQRYRAETMREFRPDVLKHGCPRDPDTGRRISMR